MRIILTGGGSGGHLFPLIAVTRQLKKKQANADYQGLPLEIVFIGSDSFGKEFLQQEGILCKFILGGKLRRYFSVRNILEIPLLFVGFIQALWHIFIYMPDVIFSKGGHDSLLIVLAGWLYRIPILIHESDSIPGLANYLGGRLATRVAVSFQETLTYFPPQKTALVGNPIREEMFGGLLDKAKEIFGLSGVKPILLVIGGSQGAQAINEIILSILSALLEKVEIIHQCGPTNFLALQKLTTGLTNYHIYPFLNEEQMKHAYVAADLIISRAGAGSIFEISAYAKPSILIPLPGAAADHQTANAYNYAKTGAADVFEQANLTPNLFQSKVLQLVDNQPLRQKMSEGARAFYRASAAQIIAEELIRLGTR